MGPEHAPADEIPIPQAAAAEIERRVDAAAHGVMDEVGLTCARRLPMESKAENEHDEPRGRRERDGQRRGRAPLRKHGVEWLQDGKHAGWISQGPYRRECVGA